MWHTVVEFVAQAPFVAEPPDFSNIGPDDSGVPKSGVLYVAARVLLFFGLGILFLVLVGGIILWAAGHIFEGIHLTQRAKTYITRAVIGAIALTSIGGIWTWLTTV
ncbi:hypothetical protein GCM10012275_43100 [Longimycelium tulufanense]|uniref:Uncharacterized protein n=1 Tax=Longimycelium tulufanense TaxID=907463 RepID=A0A8J3CB18_9PSEU|nr:hypothetical protein [Longimycelium tulufanense]GGM67905.1 hypothetical protein GCM10012275_43100 [Longimycelium tulufanense]